MMRGHRIDEAGFTLLELMIVVAIVGVLSAVAIPSFVKYITRSKTAEARLNVEKMYIGARIYFLDSNTRSPEMNAVPAQFPNAQAATPALGCCSLGGGKCAPQNTYWDTPSWTALQFSMPDPHYYQYEFISRGTAAASEFTAQAVGDLDCDGLRSTYSMYGRADQTGTAGTAALSRLNELE